MKKLLAVILAAAGLPPSAPAAQAQNLDEIFRKVRASVVVVPSKGRDVVNGMDEITVEGVAGEVVRATLLSAPMRPPMSRSCRSSA